MPLTDQLPVNSYAATGGTTTFPYTFKIFGDSDLLVTVDGATKVLGVNYTVTGAGGAGGGEVIFAAAPTGTVVIQRNMAYARSTDYAENGDFLSDMIDNDLDAVIMMLQQLSRELRRSIKMPSGETTDQQIVETPAGRANKVFGFDAAGGISPRTIADLSSEVVTIGQGLQLLAGDLSWNGVVVAKRQSVCKAAVDSDGYADFLSSPGGLVMTVAATTVPIYITFAAGFGPSGPVDYYGVIAADANVNVANAATNYIYVDRAADGTLTLGATTLRPVYERAYASQPLAQTDRHWFNPQTMKMYRYSGSVWEEKQRVFIGQCTAAGGVVNAFHSYAINGQWDSGWFAVVHDTVYTKYHRLGILPQGGVKFHCFFSTDGTVNSINVRPGHDVAFYGDAGTSAVGHLLAGGADPGIIVTAYFGPYINAYSGVPPTSGYYRILAERIW